MYPGIVQQENLANTEEQLRRLLFGKGQEGVWFDPSDLSTMFQDELGSTVVQGDGDPMAFMLDKHAKQFWPQMQTTESVEGVPIGGASVNGYVVSTSLSAGVRYLITFEVVGYNGTNDVGVRAVGAYTSPSKVNASGRRSSDGFCCVCIEADATASLQLYTRDTNTCNFENIRVYDVTQGNHAIASSPTNFTYRTDGTLHWIECFTVGTLTFTGAGYQNISNVCQFSALKRLGNSYTTTMSSSPEQVGRWLMVNNPTGAGNTTLNNASFFQQGVNRLNGTTFIDDRAVLANALQNPAVIGVTEINCINSNGIAINISGRYDLSSFDGSNFYGFIEWQDNSSLAVVQKVEQYLANKAGITLP